MGVRIITGDCRTRLAELPDASVQCCVTSPPYFGLRDYGVAGQIGLEDTPDAFVAEMVAVFRDVRRVLRDDGTLWLNLGDSYASGTKGSGGTGKSGLMNDGREEGQRLRTADASNGRAKFDIRRFDIVSATLKPKDLIGIPWRVAFALQADGWWLRQDIIWHKPNPMPESVTDRCTKAHEYLFLLSKSATYHYDADAIAEAALGPVGDPMTATGRGSQHKQASLGQHLGGYLGANEGRETRNRRSVWTVATQPFSDWTETVRRQRVAADALEDGKKRITSPDCPVHGDRCRPASTAGDGERVGEHQPRNAGTGSHPAPSQPAGSASTGSLREQGIAPSSSDCSAPPNAASATGRSIESRRTAPAPATSPAYIASAETASRTPDTSGQPERSGSAGRRSESNIAAALMADNPGTQIPDRIARTSGEQASSVASHGSDCTCEWYIEIADKTSHFATFPPALIEPCILAGCPAGGTVLDPFFGAGTTGLVADRLGRDCIGIELNPEYAAMAKRRIGADAGMFAAVEAA